MNKFIFIELMVLFFSLSVKAQLGKRVCYEFSNSVSEIEESGSVLKDSVYTIAIDTGESIKVSIFNTTKDTVFLFSSYLKDDYIQSKYLHRINENSEEKKISFLPITPFLSTSLSDKIILGSDAIISFKQIEYEFIVIPPMKVFEKYFSNKSLYINLFTRDINLQALNPFSKLKFKVIDVSKHKKYNAYKNIVEFAIYKNVENLCDDTMFHLEMGAFTEQALDYKVLSAFF